MGVQAQGVGHAVVVVLPHIAVVGDELGRPQGLLVEVDHGLVGVLGGIARTHFVLCQLHGLPDDGEELLLPVRKLPAYGEGPGDVGGVVAVLSPQVHQQQVPVLRHAVVVGVVEHDRVLPGGGNRLEAVAQAAAGHVVLVVGGPLVFVFAGPGALQHLLQRLDGHVPRLADALDLLRGLDSAQGGDDRSDVLDGDHGEFFADSPGELLRPGGRGEHGPAVKGKVNACHVMGEVHGGIPLKVLHVLNAGNLQAAALRGPLPGQHLAVPLDDLLVRLVNEQP